MQPKRKAGPRDADRPSKSFSLAANEMEFTASALAAQWIARKFRVSLPVARAIATLAAVGGRCA